MEIKIIFLEDKLKYFRKQSKDEQNQEIINCMLLGYSPYNMCLEIGINVYGGQRPLVSPYPKNSVKKKLTKSLKPTIAFFTSLCFNSKRA